MSLEKIKQVAPVLFAAWLCCIALPAAQAENLAIDPDSGLVIAPGFELVRGHCVACHSGKLITQNRMSRNSWLKTIKWMQDTQGLWDLGEQQGIVLDYLAEHYQPMETGRRPPLAASLMP